MRLPESLKAGLQAFTTSRYSPPKEVQVNQKFFFTNLVQLPTSVHDTPAGAYPSEGPQPSKWPVGVQYFISLLLFWIPFPKQLSVDFV